MGRLRVAPQASHDCEVWNPTKHVDSIISKWLDPGSNPGGSTFYNGRGEMLTTKDKRRAAGEFAIRVAFKKLSDFINAGSGGTHYFYYYTGTSSGPTMLRDIAEILTDAANEIEGSL